MSVRGKNQYQHNNLLSICIPTYNRCEKLKECLSAIIPKVREYNICFFISDNASTDNTELVVKEMQTQYPYIIYSRNIQNIGACRNFERVLKLSDTRYRWLMGDDDIIEEEKINRLMEELRIDNQYAMIVLNRKKLNHSYNTQKKEYTDMNQLLSQLGGHMTWISTLIFSDKMVNNADFKTYFDTNFIQLGIIFGYLVKDYYSVLFLPDIMVIGLPNSENSNCNKMFKLFVIDFNRTMKLLPNYYTDKAKNFCIKKHMLDYLYTYSFLSSIRIYNEINIIKFFKYYREILIAFPPIGVITVFLISIMPICLLEWMQKSWRFIKKFSKNNLHF